VRLRGFLLLCKSQKEFRSQNLEYKKERVKMIWEDIDAITEQYKKTAGIAINAEQFNLYSNTHHSTKIEGSTLTQEETNTLLEKGISVGGKPIEHQNMVLDHYDALVFVLEEAKKKRTITVSFIQEISTKVMRRTGKEVTSVSGTTDEKEGDFRKVTVTAGGHYFVDARKVPTMVKSLVKVIDTEIKKVKSIEERLTLSFLAHFDLVGIHPFTDGNGRTSRLLMNYIEAYHNLPLTLVNAADKSAYINALNESRKAENKDAIITFMANQHLKELKSRMSAYFDSKKINIKKKKSEDEKKYSLIF
jgi:Fic family protein